MSDVKAGDNVRVIPTLDEAMQVSCAARLDYEQRYENYVGISLDSRIGNKWWPLSVPSSN